VCRVDCGSKGAKSNNDFASRLCVIWAHGTIGFGEGGVGTISRKMGEASGNLEKKLVILRSSRSRQELLSTMKGKKEFGERSKF